MRTLHITLALVLASAGTAAAGEMSKEQCLDAHSRGQDAKEQGKLSLARKLFLSCAQSACPNAVQNDCSRFVDDLSAQQPSIVLAARDGNGNDLPNTTVYIDGALVVTTLDGRPVDIDPGTHTLKFSNGGKDEVVTVVIGAGEKGRTVAARFGSPSSRRGNDSVSAPITVERHVMPTRRSGPKTTHPKGAMAIAIGGGALALTGAAVAFYGASRVPGSCSLSTNQCSAPPGDPVFAKAASGAQTMNIGIVTGVVGVTALTGGLVWYFAGAKTKKESPTQVSPVVTHDSAGFAVSGRF